MQDLALGDAFGGNTPQLAPEQPQRSIVSTDARVGQAAGKPATDLDAGRPARLVALDGQRPVARRCVVQRARAGQSPDIRADRVEHLPPALAEETGEAA